LQSLAIVWLFLFHFHVPFTLVTLSLAWSALGPNG
jgi:hypothetical protein